MALLFLLRLNSLTLHLVLFNLFCFFWECVLGSSYFLPIAFLGGSVKLFDWQGLIPLGVLESQHHFVVFSASDHLRGLSLQLEFCLIPRA